RFVAVGRMRLRRAYLKGRRVLLIGEDVRFEPQPRCGERQHAAQLSAAKNADGASRRHGSGKLLGVAHCEGASATESVCVLRHCARRCASASSDSAKTAAVCRAAFFAPASPMAKVATGTPPGICTMESKLSMPFSALLSMGT